MFKRASVLILALHLSTALFAQNDVKDHPLVSRFQGSQVLEHSVTEFDEFPLPLGPIVNATTFVKAQKIEGKITKFKYSMPPNRSALEVFRSYDDALRRAGFQVLYSCAGNDCKSDKFTYGYEHTASGIWCFSCEEPMRYLGAKVSKGGRDAYVSLVVVKDKFEGGTWLSIVEPKPMAGGQVTVDAAALANDIVQTGHAAIYGIYFDTGKAIVKPESDPTLAQISKLLESHADIKLHVVGHTDNVGPLAANMTLAKQRAAAVMAALVTRYHVAPSRLQADGVGPLAPVATNRTEDGRSKNRRVELVEQ